MKCDVRVDDRSGQVRRAVGATVLLETDELIIRGEARVRVPRTTIERVERRARRRAHGTGSTEVRQRLDGASGSRHRCRVRSARIGGSAVAHRRGVQGNQARRRYLGDPCKGPCWRARCRHLRGRQRTRAHLYEGRARVRSRVCGKTRVASRDASGQIQGVSVATARRLRILGPSHSGGQGERYEIHINRCLRGRARGLRLARSNLGWRDCNGYPREQS